MPFWFRGQGAISTELDVDLSPGEQALIPIYVFVGRSDCRLTGRLRLVDLDDWSPPRSFDLRAQLVRDGPRFRPHRNVRTCSSPDVGPLLRIWSRDMVSVDAIDGLGPIEGEVNAFESTDCDQLNGAVEVQSPSGRTARIPVGLRPSAACGDDFRMERRIQVDEYEVLARPKADVIWILDDTVSMRPFWPDLVENFDAFIQFAQAQGNDNRIFIRFLEGGWVRDELGAPRAFDLSPGNGREAFLAALGDPSFSGGIELTLDVAVEAATTVPLRPGASLSVIAVTNEADQSMVDVDDAVNKLLSVKGFRNTQLFSFSAVSGGPSGCETLDGLMARPAPRLVEVAHQTGGLEESICTVDWSRTYRQRTRSARSHSPSQPDLVTPTSSRKAPSWRSASS